MNKKTANSTIEQPLKQTSTKIRPLKARNMARRLMDNSSSLRSSPDRRVENAERRSLDKVDHSSPVRRYTVDRRSGTKDRRNT